MIHFSKLLSFAEFNAVTSIKVEYSIFCGRYDIFSWKIVLTTYWHSF